MRLKKLSRQDILEAWIPTRVIVDQAVKWGYDPIDHFLYGGTLERGDTISLTIDPNPISIDPQLRRARHLEWQVSISETMDDSDECLTPDGTFLNDELVYSYHLYVIDTCN